MADIRFLPCGDSAVTVEFGSVVDEALNGAVHAFAAAAEGLGHPAIREAVPTYRSATVHYLPWLLDFDEIQALLAPLARQAGGQAAQEEAVIEIPTLYGGEYGPDLEEVAAHCGLSPDQIVALHSAPAYRIFMLGFTPGFPYLGGMDPKLATPRRSQPRVSIPAGSVGIAGSQTGVYPIQSPGGWQLIGRTPLRLFDPALEPPILLQAGGRVRFVPIDEETFRQIERRGR